MLNTSACAERAEATKATASEPRAKVLCMILLRDWN